MTDCTGGRQGGEEGSQGAPAECSEHLSKRADARRNRAQILVAAEICFAEQGVGVPIDDIARRACVGVGTVYRHFPTKEALAEAVVVTRMEKLDRRGEISGGERRCGGCLLRLPADPLGSGVR